MRVNVRWPSDKALNIATRSAHTVRPYVAFSMLQPVITWPSAVSSAAPTLKCEKSACACSLARLAASINASLVISITLTLGSGDHGFQQRDELGSHAARGFHHFVVIERRRQHTGGHVRDAGN